MGLPRVFATISRRLTSGWVVSYTEGAHLDNYRSPLTKGETKMDENSTVMEFIEVWLETFKKNSVKVSSYGRLETSKNTLAGYEIAKKKIGEVNFFDIQRYINQLVDDGYSMSNIKKQLRIVTSPLKLAASMKIIHADPSIGVKLPNETRVKKKTKEVVAYTEDEQDRLFKRVAVCPMNAGYMGILFMIETGLRSGELLALKWKDVQLDRSRVHVHATILNPMSNVKAVYQDSPKTKSSNRIVPLTPKAKAILKRLMEDRQTEWVFESKGHRYSYKQLMYQTKKLCGEAGVPYYGEHVFRHTFATNCYYKGIDVKILSRLMGHSSVSVTYNTYINLYGDGFDEMYAALCL